MARMRARDPFPIPVPGAGPERGIYHNLDLWYMYMVGASLLSSERACAIYDHVTMENSLSKFQLTSLL